MSFDPSTQAEATTPATKADLSRFPEITKQFIKALLSKKAPGLVQQADGVWLFSFESYLRAKGEAESHIPVFCRVMQKATGGKPYEWLNKQLQKGGFMAKFFGILGKLTGKKKEVIAFKIHDKDEVTEEALLVLLNKE
jgi:hypothetical protein